jgi:hypothetical protein
LVNAFPIRRAQRRMEDGNKINKGHGLTPQTRLFKAPIA